MDEADVAGGFLVELPLLGLLLLDETGTSTRNMMGTTTMWQVRDYPPSNSNNTAFKRKHSAEKRRREVEGGIGEPATII